MRGLPTVTLSSADPEWLEHARCLVEAVGATLVGASTSEPPPAGVSLSDNRSSPVPQRGVVLRVGVDPEVGHDLPWPLSPATLEGALRGAAATLAAKGLLSETNLAEAAFRKLVELSADSIEVVDRRVRLLYVNPAFEEVTGYTLPEVLGRTTGDLFRAGTHDPAFYAGIMEVLGRGEAWRGQLVARRADGALSYQESVLAPFSGPDGATAGYVALKRDLARDALLARAAEHVGDQRSALFEEVADAFLLHDEHGQVLDRNDSAVRMFALDAAPSGGFLDTVLPEDSARLLDAWAALKAGEPVALDVRVVAPQAAANQTVSLRSVRVRVAGEDLVLTIGRDITERVALERALTDRGRELTEALSRLERTSAALVEREKQAALGGLVAGVAHELNTPIGVAVTALSIAEAGIAELDQIARTGQPTRRMLTAVTERAGESLQLVQEQLRRAAQLVTDFKRLSVTEVAAQPGRCNLLKQARRVVHSLQPLLREHNVHFQILGEPVERVVDPAAFAQILGQLISNVAHHAGGCEARLTVLGTPAGARVLVEDDGPGLEPDTVIHAFEPFFTTARGRGRVGLGLHVAQSLVAHRLGGEIRIESQPGAGTRVEFTLVDAAD